MPRYFSSIRSSCESTSLWPNPHSVPRPLVQHLGKRLRQPVSERLAHDRVVVVVIALELLDQRLKPDARCNREGPQVISHARLARRDVIRQRAKRRLPVTLPLLP